jgi:hypothetical protein
MHARSEARTRMSLSDGDIAALARAAADAIDPHLDVRIVPADPVDPYSRSVTAWTVIAGSRSSYVTADMSWRDALEQLSRDLAP